MEIGENEDFIFCRFCGTKLINIKQKLEITQNINQNINVSGTVNHRMDLTGQPNLHISYNASDPTVPMIVVIDYPKGKHHFTNGQIMTFHLPVGPHQIKLKIGKRSYSRIIMIPPSDFPVKKFASWNKRAHISIDQP